MDNILAAKHWNFLMEFLLLAIFWETGHYMQLKHSKVLMQFKFAPTSYSWKLLLNSTCLQYSNICSLATRSILSDDPLKPANPQQLTHLNDQLVKKEVPTMLPTDAKFKFTMPIWESKCCRFLYMARPCSASAIELVISAWACKINLVETVTSFLLHCEFLQDSQFI
jgi:hypothetical protein